MKTILKRWYSGDFFLGEEIVPRDADYYSMSRKISDEREYFKAKLPLEDQERFEEWDALMMHLSGKDCYANFSYGFKLGALLMCEIYTGGDGPEV